MITVYLIVTTVVTLVAILKIPSKMNTVNNVGGSILLAVCAGWIIWPLALWAWVKSSRKTRNARIGL